jgi:nucleoside-diphosphate-sugar epimerase
MTRWVIVGAGYTGARVAALVTALGERGGRHPPDRRAGGARRRPGAAGDPRRAVRRRRSGGGDRAADRRRRDGERALGAAAAAAGVARLVYVSSTGVYAPAAGAWVDEAFAIAPTTAAGRARVAAEAALVASGVPLVIVRPAGIYGPDRGPIARLRAGHYRVVGDGATAVSRIHVDDLAALVVAAATAAAPAPSYNAADDDPASSAALADAAAAALGLPTPPRVPLSAVDPETVGMLTADRRIANQRAKRDLGWAPRYPSWRTALAEELRWC